VNHYYFRTSAYDLGIYNNAIFDYSHFRVNNNTVIFPHLSNKLADHFSVFQILFSPFIYVFGTYTLLIFQILFILIGGIGASKLVEYITESKKIALIALIHFYSLFGITSALSFDYHDNVIGAMIVPWIFLFFLKKKWVPLLLTTLVAILCKETIAFWMFFIGVSLLLLSKSKKQRFIAIGISLFSAIYFVVVTAWIMPSLSDSVSGYLHFKYNVLGGNYSEMIINIFKDPLRSIELLFINHLESKSYNDIKKEFWIMFLFGGGFACILRPKIGLAILPIIFTKLYNDGYEKWGINAHYSIETVPILIISFYFLIQKIPEKIGVGLAVIVCVSTIWSNIDKLDKRDSKWYDKYRGDFLYHRHYKREFDVEKLHEFLSSLPEDMKICTQSDIIPHLAFRNHIYAFPIMQKANYLLMHEKMSVYPFRTKASEEIQKILDSQEWKVIYNENSTILFERIIKI